MRITLTRSGGFSGVRLRHTVDEAKLSAHQAARLRKLVAAADCFRLPKRLAAHRKQPDRFQYHVTFEDGRRKHAVRLDEEAASPEMLALLDWVSDPARKPC